MRTLHCRSQKERVGRVSFSRRIGLIGSITGMAWNCNSFLIGLLQLAIPTSADDGTSNPNKEAEAKQIDGKKRN